MFLVTELQTYKDGTLGRLDDSYEDISMAESKYHLILSSAAISEVPIHAAMVYDNEGNVLYHHAYYHPVPEPEPEPEEEDPEVE